MRKHTIRPIPLCRGPRDRSQWTYRMNYGQIVDTCNYSWLIEDSGKTILVDTGAPVEMYQRKGISEECVQTLDEGLGKIALKPEDIDIVILTHLHWDHVAEASRFVKARFVVQRLELDFAQNPHPAAAPDYQAELFQKLNLKTVEGDCQIDDGISVLLTPGHSRGGQSVVIDTPNGVAIITGFCCTYDTFNTSSQAKAQGFVVNIPGLHINTLEAYDSALRIKQLADIILPLHDAAFISRCRIP